MATHIRLAIGAIGIAVLLGVTALARGAGDDQTASATTPPPAGAYLFRTYCASCHGTSARGDGPLADSLQRRPADLTELLKRNNGVYPSEMVFRVIDGREKVRGHGGPDMPAWGDAFLRSIEGGDEESVKRRITALVDYLEMIQARDVQ